MSDLENKRNEKFINELSYYVSKYTKTISRVKNRLGNRDYVRELIDQYSIAALAIAGDDIRDDKRFILTLDLHQIGLPIIGYVGDRSVTTPLLYCVSPRLTNDVDIIKHSIIYGYEFLFASESAKTNQSILLEVVACKPQIYKYIQEEIKHRYITVSCVAIAKSAKNLEYLPENLRQNETFLNLILDDTDEKHFIDLDTNTYFGPLSVCGETLQNNVEFIKKCIKHDYLAIQAVPKKLLDSKDFLDELFDMDIAWGEPDSAYEGPYKYCSDRLKNNKNIIKRAIEITEKDKTVNVNYRAINYINENLFKNEEFLKELISINPRIIELLQYKYKNNKDLMIVGVKKDYQQYFNISKGLQKDRDVLFAAITNAHGGLDFLLKTEFNKDRKLKQMLIEYNEFYSKYYMKKRMPK